MSKEQSKYEDAVALVTDMFTYLNFRDQDFYIKVLNKKLVLAKTKYPKKDEEGVSNQELIFFKKEYSFDLLNNVCRIVGDAEVEETRTDVQEGFYKWVNDITLYEQSVIGEMMIVYRPYFEDVVERIIKGAEYGEVLIKKDDWGVGIRFTTGGEKYIAFTDTLNVDTSIYKGKISDHDLEWGEPTELISQGLDKIGLPR